MGVAHERLPLRSQGGRVAAEVALAAALLAWCLLSSGCDFNPHPSQDNPRKYGYHFHPLSFITSATNWPASLDSVTAVEVTCGFLHTQRPGESIYASALGFGTPVSFTLTRDDTASACTTSCEHLTGYQLRYGGDTLHFGELDSREGWAVRLCVVRATAVAASGARYQATSVDVVSFPDTVREGRPTEIELVFDMAGFLSWTPGGQRPLKADSAYVAVRQR